MQYRILEKNNARRKLGGRAEVERKKMGNERKSRMCTLSFYPGFYPSPFDPRSLEVFSEKPSKCFEVKYSVTGLSWIMLSGYGSKSFSVEVEILKSECVGTGSEMLSGVPPHCAWQMQNGKIFTGKLKPLMSLSKKSFVSLNKVLTLD